MLDLCAALVATVRRESAAKTRKLHHVEALLAVIIGMSAIEDACARIGYRGVTRQVRRDYDWLSPDMPELLVDFGARCVAFPFPLVSSAQFAAYSKCAYNLCFVPCASASASASSASPAAVPSTTTSAATTSASHQRLCHRHFRCTDVRQFECASDQLHEKREEGGTGWLSGIMLGFGVL